MNAPLPKVPISPGLLPLLHGIHAAQTWHRPPRNGKVARLPESTRNLINQMLEDGVPYLAIIDKLQGTGLLPYPLSQMNLSNWRRGGFLDWRRKQLEAAIGITPASMDLATALSLCSAQESGR